MSKALDEVRATDLSIYDDYIDDYRRKSASSLASSSKNLITELDESELSARAVLGYTFGTLLFYNPFEVALVLLSIHHRPIIAWDKRMKQRGRKNNFTSSSESEPENFANDGEEDDEFDRELMRSISKKSQKDATKLSSSYYGNRNDRTDSQGYLVQEVEDSDEDVDLDEKGQVISRFSGGSNGNPVNRLTIKFFPEDEKISTSRSSSMASMASVASLSLWSSIKIISHYIGIAGLYRGLFTAFLESLGKYYSTKWLLKSLSMLPNQIAIGTVGKEFLSHALVSLTFHPFTVLRTRLIAQNVIRKERIYHGFRHGLWMMWKENGIWSFYGYFSFMTFYYVAKAISLHIPSLLVDALEDGGNGFLSQSLVGRISVFCLTSIACSLITIPLETIYYRLMMISSSSSSSSKSHSSRIKNTTTSSSSSAAAAASSSASKSTPILALATCVPVKPYYHGGLDAFSRIWREEGVGAFYPLWSYRMFASCISQFADTVEISTN